jgi:hypothetical protein
MGGGCQCVSSLAADDECLAVAKFLGPRTNQGASENLAPIRGAACANARQKWSLKMGQTTAEPLKASLWSPLGAHYTVTSIGQTQPLSSGAWRFAWFSVGATFWNVFLCPSLAGCLLG